MQNNREQNSATSKMVLLLKLYMWSYWYVSSVHTTLKVGRIFFSSLDFCTILHWEATCDGQPTCSYEIQYKVYGESEWQNKTDCEEMKNLCNMTAETLMKENVDEKIFARVRAKTENAKSSWKKSKEFLTLRDTKISAPAVIVTSSSNTILVHITAPQLLYHIKYADTNYQEETSFIIKMSAASQLIKTEYTKKTIWSITNLAPGNYCISVNMMFGEITSSSSPNKCVEIRGAVAKEVILGFILAVFASVVIVAILTIYLILYRNVFYPKPPLPSNLILHNKESKASDNKSDVDLTAPSIFEGMELIKYILAADVNVKKHLENKRYVSTENWRKDYVNCRPKAIDRNSLLDKRVELRNSTYETKNLPTNVWKVSQARYTKVEMSPHHTHLQDKVYYNDFIKHGEFCHKPRHSYVNQDDNLSHVYVNNPQLLYSNTSDKEGNISPRNIENLSVLSDNR